MEFGKGSLPLVNCLGDWRYRATEFCKEKGFQLVAELWVSTSVSGLD